MSLWPDTIELADVSIPLADVLAELTIHHGRAGVFDDPTATTCQLTLLDVERELARDFRVGEPLTVTVTDGASSSPRFTGRITDATLAVDDLTMIAVGRLSTLNRYPVGLAPWPAEPWATRVGRIFAEAGLSSLLELHSDPDFDPMLAGRDPATAGETTLGDYLAFLAPMVGAAVTDRMDGRILVQALAARSLLPAERLEPADVAYAPAWLQVLPIGNVVTVRYTGDQSESVTLRDEASIGFYGEMPATIDTTFVEQADAATRAHERLARGAFSRWAIPEAPIVRGLDLQIGQAVELVSMPAASPWNPWRPLLEGWRDEISGDDWQMTLALSDPLSSGIGLPWTDVPTEYAWNEIDQAAPWREALTLEDVLP